MKETCPIHCRGGWMLIICLWAALMMPALGLAAAVTPTATAATSQTDVQYPGLEMKASIGYDGVITYLRKLPLQVSLVNNGPDLSGLLVMNVNRDERQYDRYEYPVTVASGAQVRVTLPVELTMKQRQYQLELYIDGEVVAAETITPSRLLDPSTLLVAALSAQPQALAHLNITTSKDPLKRGEQWQVVGLTAETFPTEVEMLSAFALLAIDGVDANALNAQQQQALDTWIRNGGIVILGGGAQAAAGYPFFEKYTGITAGAPYQGPDITEELLAFVKSAEKPLGEPVLLNSLTGAKNILIKGEAPILDITAVENGYVMTAAFSLSDKPINAWQNTNVLWQRLMLAAIGDRYQQIATAQKEYYSRNNTYVDYAIMNAIEIANDSSFLMPLILLLVFVGLVGFGSYFLLKKRDKREWMWATIPAFSLAFALALWAIGHWTSFRQSVAVISDYVQQDETGLVTEKAAVSVAMAELGPMTITAKGGTVKVFGNQNNYYQQDASAPKEPDTLRYTYHQGQDTGLTLPATAAWTSQSFMVERSTPSKVKVNASCWWEDDGFYVRLINEGSQPLNPGWVITSLGYVSVPELLPGQTVELMLKNPETKTKVNPLNPYNGNGNVPVQEGVVFTKAQISSVSVYSLASAIVYPEYWMDTSQSVSIDWENGEREARTQLENRFYYCFNRWNVSTFDAVYHYLSFDDAICDIDIAINGQAIRRIGQSNIIDIKLKYQPVSSTGIAKFVKGTIPTYMAELDDAKKPVCGMSGQSNQQRYFRIVDKPIFCFVLPEEARKLTINDLDIVCEYIYGDFELSLYNTRTGAWVIIDTKKALKGQIKWEDYVDEQGQVFASYTPSLTTDPYGDMSMPYLTIDGRVQ